MVAIIWLPGLASAHCQEAQAPVVMDAAQASNTLIKTESPPATDVVPTQEPRPVKRPVDSEIAVTGMIPDGDYRLFSATVRCTAWTIGVEYDRHSLGHILKSQVDWAMEVMPFVLLSQPAVSDFWGNAESPNQEWVPGLSISPVGFRFRWRSNAAIKPFIVGKLGAIVFDKKAFSQSASYANFNIQAAFGVQFRLNKKVDLRVEPFEFFHVSNGYLAASNPGMDQLATRIGISYHLGKQER